MDSSYIWYVYIVLIVAMVYFFGIRPERKRKKKAEDLRNALKVGETITTIGGFIGKVVYMNDNSLVIETGEDRVRFEIARWAVSAVGRKTDNNTNG